MSYLKAKKSQFELLFAGILSIIFLTAFSCGGEKTGDTAQTDQTAPVEEFTDSLAIELAGADSLSVFEILRGNHEVDYKSSLQGVFVTAIDSVAGGGGYLWIYEVNDSTATVACDKYMTRNGDKIMWYFRKM